MISGNKLRKLKVFCGICVAVCCIGVGVFLASKNVAADSGDGVKELPQGLTTETVYESSVGSVLDLSTAYIQKGGEKLETFAQVTHPDGRITTEKTIKLDLLGKYKVVLYGYALSGDFEKYEYDLYAYNSAFLFSDAQSITYYGEHKNEKGFYGQIVSLYEGATATYGKIIDLNAELEEDIVFEWSPIASSVGAGDFTYVEFKFTDRYNPENFVTVTGNYHHIYQEAYFKAAAPGQILSGYYAHGGWVHIGNEYGSPAQVSFYNTPRWGGSLKSDAMRLKIDMKTKTVNVGNTFVIDLDDPKYFSNLWSGFTTGEVVLSVSCGGYISNKPAEFMFTEICGEPLKGEPIKDNIAPVLTVDLGEYTKETIPAAQVGQNYAIFPASAWDNFDDNVNIKTEIWLNYGSTNQTQVNSKDGYFIPTREAFYTIVYTACDRSGQETIETVRVKAFTKLSDIRISIIEKEKTQFALGQILTINDCTYAGGSGKLEKYVKIKTPGGKEKNWNDEEPFILDEKGEYEIIYVVEDYIGLQGTAGYKVRVTDADVPLFYGEPILPKALLANVEYRLPELYAYDYTSGKGVAIKAKIKIWENGKTKVLDSNVYKPTFSSDGEITVAYIASNDKGEGCTTNYKIPVLNVGEATALKTSGYFTGSAKAENDAGGYLIATANRNGDYLEYALPALSNNFTVNFNSAVNGGAIGRLTLKLTDSENTDETLDITFTKKDIGSLLAVNGKSYTISETLASSLFNVTYLNAKNLKVGNISYPLEAFRGFSSGKVYIRLTFDEISSECKIRINSINGQLFSVTMDETKPKIFVMGEYGGIVNKDSIITLNRAAAADVFDPCITAYVTVRDPGGSIVVAEDGTRLEKADISREYQIRVSDYGYYKITYYLEDWNDNLERNFSYQYIVEDRSLPEIILDKTTVSGKVNQIIDLPKATVTDVYPTDTSVSLDVFIVKPNGLLIRLKADEDGGFSYKPETAGMYYVRYYCMDSYGNNTMKEIVLTVG